MNRLLRCRYSTALWGVLLTLVPAAPARVKSKLNAEQARSDYISKIEQQTVASPAETTLGSLWRPDGALTDISTDYKAHRVNDTVTLVVVQQTTAQASGDVSSQRSFTTQSGITGAAGRVNTAGLNPLLAANSSTTLKGKGTADASSLLRTSLTGQVIAVLPNGNLVVEAQRIIAVNNQKETMIVRGVLRPGDVSPQNSAPSTALSNLEIELKGKGVISDATRPPNPIMRAILWVIGF